MIPADESDIELIERYLMNRLSEDELRLFLNRLKTDPDFSEKTEDLRAIIHGIKHIGTSNIRAEITNWENEIRAQEKKDSTIASPSIRISSLRNSKNTNKKADNTISWKTYLAIAAVVALLIFAFLNFFNLRETKDLDQLFAAHFNPYAELLTTRDDQGHAGLSQGLESYNKKQYDQAIEHFDKYLRNNPNDFRVWFYLGVSQVATGKNFEAIHSFDKVIKSKTVFQDSAEWYKALAYLNMKDVKSAKNLLQSIQSQEEHDYRSNAAVLLTEINSAN